MMLLLRLCARREGTARLDVTRPYPEYTLETIAFIKAFEQTLYSGQFY